MAEKGLTHTFKYPNGSPAECIISGFKGVITSRSEHTNGCDRYWVQPKVDKDGKFCSGTWFDEVDLKVTSAPIIEKKNPERGGFPSPEK
jgi:hypothetical protein